MPVIGRVSNGGSSDLAIDYALGKDKKMKNNTVEWLKENGIDPNEIDFVGSVHNSRAVVAGGTNGISGLDAKEMFSLNQKLFNQTKKKNQVKKIVQSFSHNEADPLNPLDWQKANDIGVEFAKKAYPDYQCVVLTQIDNKNHLVHNHIDVDKVNLKTGHKLKEPRRIDDYRKINDELAKKYGMEVIPPKREKTLNAEKIHGRKAYVSYVKKTVDEIMLNSEIKNKQDFIQALDRADIIYTDVNKMNRFVSKTVKNKSGKPLVVRGKTLGMDYEKGAINHELDVRERDSKTEEREPRIERAIERTSQIERNYNESKIDYTESETDKQQAETDKRTAESDQIQQSRIAEFIANFERKANEIRKRIERVKSKIRAKIIPQRLLKQAQEQQQPTKPERDKYGLSRVQRLMVDNGNKILREHGLGDLQMGYDGKTLRENEAEKNHKVAKPLEKKLTKGQIQTVYFANKKYLSAGLPSYRINYDGLSYKYDVKFQKQQRQKSAENQVAQSQQQSKKQPVRRHVSHRLQIKHNNQNQNKNIDRGPKM